MFHHVSDTFGDDHPCVPLPTVEGRPAGRRPQPEAQIGLICPATQFYSLVFSEPLLTTPRVWLYPWCGWREQLSTNYMAFKAEGLPCSGKLLTSWNSQRNWVSGQLQPWKNVCPQFTPSKQGMNELPRFKKTPLPLTPQGAAGQPPAQRGSSSSPWTPRCSLTHSSWTPV